MPVRLVSLASVLTAVVASVLTAACGGSSEDASIFTVPPEDAGPTPSSDAAPLATNGPDAGGDGACAPVVVPAAFKPTWRPPNGLHSGACTAQQMSDFYDACLTPPVDTAACDAYAKKNAPCSTCLATDDTAATLGPVVWHQSRAFFTINVAGCIANEQGDTSSTSCGASYQALLECKETSCASCFDDPSATFQKFSACEQQASPQCTTFSDSEHAACGDALRDAGSPSSKCLPPGSTPAKTVYGFVAPLFCGQ